MEKRNKKNTVKIPKKINKSTKKPNTISVGHWNKGSSFLTTGGKMNEIKAIITGGIQQDGMSSFDIFLLSEMNLLRDGKKELYEIDGYELITTKKFQRKREDKCRKYLQQRCGSATTFSAFTKTWVKKQIK